MSTDEEVKAIFKKALQAPIPFDANNTQEEYDCRVSRLRDQSFVNGCFLVHCRSLRGSFLFVKGLVEISIG